MAKMMKSKSQLEEIAIKRIRAWPGCWGASNIVLTLDDDGEWALEVSDAGSADAETVHRAAIAVGDTMHDEFDLAGDSWRLQCAATLDTPHIELLNDGARLFARPLQ